MLSQPLNGFERYLKAEEGLSAATARQYRYDVGALASWLEQQGGPQHWEEVTVRDLRAYFDSRRTGHSRTRRVLSSWRKWWTYLQDVEGLEMQDAPAKIKRPREASTGKRLPAYLTPVEVSKLLKVVRANPRDAEGLRNWALLAFLYGTGCRISEMLNLTFNAIDYDPDGTPLRVRLIGKGNKERLVFLSSTAQRALYQWLRVRKLKGDPTSVYVFSHLEGHRVGQPFTPRMVQKVMARAGAAAELPPERCTPHKLRHSHATALLNQGRGIEEIKEVLGHQSIATTQLYTHVEKSRLEAAAAALPDVLDQ